MRCSPPFAFVLSALAATSAMASTFLPVEATCPIDGEKFPSLEFGSGFAHCMRLDMKRVGYISSPRPIHECPASGFTFVSDDFSPSEIAALRPWVESPAYADRLSRESRHYRLARAYAHVGRPAGEIAWRLLQASWEVERSPQKHRRYLAESLAYWERHVRETGLSTRRPATRLEERDLILFAELHRRLGNFDRAAEVLERLGSYRRVDEKVHERIIETESRLVAERVSEPRCANGDDPKRFHRPREPRELGLHERRAVQRRLQRWCRENEALVFGPENFVQREMQAQCGADRK